MICVDSDCEQCEKKAELWTCHSCGVQGMITNCGHQSQPRPIASGRSDGSALHLSFCEECA
jgi:membrane protease subunit (stomatin/prohibitin family)